MATTKLTDDEAARLYKSGYDAAERLWRAKYRINEKRLQTIIDRLQRKLLKIDRIINPKVL